MNITERIKEYITKVFNKMFNKNTTKCIECTNEEKYNCNAKKNFEESLRVNLKSTDQSKNSISSDACSTIETLQCINDGLGFQTLKKY